MTELKKPKRVSPATMVQKALKVEPIAKPNEFILPEGKLDLEFFLKREGQQYSTDQIIQEVFGAEGFRMTEQEKVYCLLRAMESLEITMPFEFICSECNEKNPIAVEVCKVMHTSGTPKETFRIEIDPYIFEFERPPHVHDTQEIPGLAGIGMYMMQWLVGHNQGPQFEFIHLPIKIILKLAEEFTKNLFTVSFDVDSHCAFCKAPIKEEFAVGMQDLAEVINEL